MLKWLQSGVQSSSTPATTLPDIITDDPLATLNFKDDEFNKRNATEIYSVSRTNPLYDGEDRLLYVEEATKSRLLQSPKKILSQTSNSSSSGYSSNRALPTPANDDADHPTEDSNECSLLELDSLEPDLFSMGNDDFDARSKSVPAPIWPQFAHRGHVALQIQRLNSISEGSETSRGSPSLLPVVQVDPQFVQGISDGSSSPDSAVSVVRNGEFVKDIQFGPSNKMMQLRPNNKVRPAGPSLKVPKMLQLDAHKTFHYRDMSPIGEVASQEGSSVPHHKDSKDSIVTEALLQMTSFSTTTNHESNDDGEGDNLPGSKKSEDMDKVIAELTQAVMKSRNVTTLTRAMKRQRQMALKDSSSDEGTNSVRKFQRRSKDKLRNSIRSLRSISKNSRGVDVMRDLWQQTGMKTNGRKLLVDSLSDEEPDQSPLTRATRQRRPCRVHGATYVQQSSPSSGSDTTPPYRSVLGRRHSSLTSSTELYAEVYRTSSGESTGYSQSDGKTNVRIRIEREDTSSTTCSSSNSAPNSPLRSHRRKSKRNNANMKKVQFSEDVFDNELTSHKLIYEKIPMASPPKKNDASIVIDIAKLNARDGYLPVTSGFNQYLPDSYYHPSNRLTGQSQVEGDYKQIFTSPYFDYRKTHSKAGSVYGSSELTLEDPNLLEQKRIIALSATKTKDKFWKAFAIFLAVTLVLAIITALTVYFFYRSHL